MSSPQVFYGLSLGLLPSSGVEYCDELVCLSVCLFVHTRIRKTTHSNFTKFSAHVACGLALSSSGGVALQYIMYFRFCGWRHVFLWWAYVGETQKISSVKSQLSKEINFEILCRSLEHVLFCEISQKKFHLWSAVIGQSASVVFTYIGWSVDDVGFRKFISSVKVLTFERNISNFFEIEFRNKFIMWKGP